MKIMTNDETLEAISDILTEVEDQPSNIRLYVSGYGWSGPSFGLALDEQKEEDLFDEIKGVRFIMEESLYDEFGDIRVESMGGGFMVMPVINSASGCGSCTGC